MIPGQLGPTRRDLDWLLRAFMTWEMIRKRMLGTTDAYPDFVSLWNTLGDANNQSNFILNCLNDGICSRGRGHIKDGCFSSGLPDSLYIDP